MCHCALNVDLAVVRYHTLNYNPNNLTIEPTIVCITKQSIIEVCTTRWNISVVMYDTYSITVNQVMDATVEHSKRQTTPSQPQ